MTLIDKALGVRIVVHCSHVVSDQVVIQSYSGSRTKAVLLSSASAETHYHSPILLRLGTFRIEKMAYIITSGIIPGASGFRDSSISP